VEPGSHTPRSSAPRRPPEGANRRLTIAAAAAATAVAVTAPSGPAEVFKDDVPSQEAYEVTFVHVNPSRRAGDPDGLKQSGRLRDVRECHDREP
jgi:hypothetical protein